MNMGEISACFRKARSSLISCPLISVSDGPSARREVTVIGRAVRVHAHVTSAVCVCTGSFV